MRRLPDGSHHVVDADCRAFISPAPGFGTAFHLVTCAGERRSHQVRRQAEAEGLDRIFKAAGAQWRFAGCSMCLGMNPDQLRPQQRCASTSNRNFEGRQGKGGRTHLVSPEMAAAAAVAGKFVDIREWPQD